MKSIVEEFKEKISNDSFVVGPFMKTEDPAFVEVAGHAGFDFVILDMEHGPTNVSNSQNLIRAAECANVLPVVRVGDSSEISIDRALDIGAKGVQVPQVTNAEQARKIVEAAKFSPRGNRGMCRFVRAAKYSHKERNEYFKEANENIIIIHLEGQEAIDNLDEILNVEGVDILFIGPYDLSQSLGYPGEVDHPDVSKMMMYIVDKARKKGKIVGTFVDTIESAEFWKQAGVKYISYSVDMGIFYEFCKHIVDDIK